jgi:hypothetical protein
VPDIFIAEPKTFWGVPGARITNGDGINKATKINKISKSLVGVGICPRVGSKDLILFSGETIF